MTRVQTTSGADARWAAARALAVGVSDDGFRQRRSRTVVRLAALVVAAWVLGVVLALVLVPSGGSSGGDHGVSDAQLVGQGVFTLLAFAVGISGFVWARRTGHYVTRWRAVSSPLDRGERRSVRRQIAGTEQPDQEHLDVVLAAARQGRRATLGVAPLHAALVLLAVGTAIGSDALVITMLEMVVSLLFVVAAVQLTVQYQRAGRFIDANANANAIAPASGATGAVPDTGTPEQG